MEFTVKCGLKKKPSVVKRVKFIVYTCPKVQSIRQAFHPHIRVSSRHGSGDSHLPSHIPSGGKKKTLSAQNGHRGISIQEMGKSKQNKNSN
jgi:hypothetical protein